MKFSFRYEGHLFIFSSNFLGLLLIGCCVINKNVGGNEHELGDIFEDKHQSWEGLQLQFLANTDESKLHSNEFHVIQATFNGGINNSSYIIHLSNSQGLHNPISNPNNLFRNLNPEDGQNTDIMQCIYSGTITEIHSTSETNSKTGIVSFSSCHYEYGFEGLILLPDEQYYIKPLSRTNIIKRSISSTYSKPTVPHKALKVDGRTNPLAKIGSIDVVLKPSPDDLEKAKQEHPEGNDQDSLEDEVSIDSTGAESTFPDLENYLDINNSIDETPFTNEIENDAASNNKPLFPPKLNKLASFSSGRGKGQRNGGGRRRRTTKSPPKKVEQAATTSANSPKRVVEIAVFTDEKLHAIWKGRYPRDTTTKMNQFVLAVINNMNALYNQPSMTESITFRLVHLEIATTKPKILKDHSGHASKYLKSFCSYSAEKNRQGVLWDHALMLTGWDLQEGGNNGTAGIAWFSTMCINGLSCSLIEGSNFGSTFITTHEIGHSLGMDHDGTGPNKNCNANSFIMSPTTGGGKTDWSICSIKNMQNFLSKGYMGNPAPKCITKKGASAGNAIHFGSSKLPGQQFGANEQCSVECQGCTPYTTRSSPYNDMCHLLYCQRKTSAYYYMIKSTHPALEGTRCANGKMCRLGKCQ